MILLWLTLRQADLPASIIFIVDCISGVFVARYIFVHVSYYLMHKSVWRVIS